MPNNVLIFKLITNEIIAAQARYNNKDKTYHLIWPVEVYFKRLATGGSAIGLYPWLITEIVLMNTSIIEESKILSISHPTEKFIEYYDAMTRYYEKYNTKELADKQLDMIIKSYNEDSFKDEDYTGIDLEEQQEEEEIIKPKTRKNKKLH